MPGSPTTRRLSAAWKRLEAWSLAEAGEVPPRAGRASAGDVAEARRVLGGLPEDYVAAITTRNGSRLPAHAPWVVAPFPTAWGAWRDLRTAPRDSVGHYVAEGAVRALDYAMHWWPFAYDGGGDWLCLDLHPAEGGTRGQVVHWRHDDPRRTVLAPSFVAWLEGIAARLETGDWGWDGARPVPRAAPPAGADLPRVSEALRARLLDPGAEHEAELPGVGTFRVRVSAGFAGETGRGLQLDVPPRVTPIFRAAPALRAALRGEPDVAPDAAEAPPFAAAGREVVASFRGGAQAVALPGMGVLRRDEGRLVFVLDEALRDELLARASD